MKNLQFMKTFCNTPIGCLEIEENNNYIVSVKLIKELNNDKYIDDNTILNEAKQQINEYFLKKRKVFDLPIGFNGTKFQKSVWNSLLKIPYGETRSYKDIAKDIGNVKACRAVGMANNKNPIMIIVPCHRVIGSNGRLVGYACGLDIKKKLLELEMNNFCNILE